MSANIIGKTSTITTGISKTEDADGKIWLQAVAHGNLTANTPYKVQYGQTGLVTAALADDTHTYWVGVPESAVTSGDVCWMQIGGRVSSLVTASIDVDTAGHCIIIDGGATADGGAYTGQGNAFALVRNVTSGASTTQDVQLIPERITGTT
jgi:hypothetical protein